MDAAYDACRLESKREYHRVVGARTDGESRVGGFSSENTHMAVPRIHSIYIYIYRERERERESSLPPLVPPLPYQSISAKRRRSQSTNGLASIALDFQA